jgi:hypothetical protein
MEGAFSAMWSGSVDENWAKEHHSLWAATAADRTRAPTRSYSAAAVSTFAVGSAIAIVIALTMVSVYERNSISTNERAALAGSAVHLGEMSSK